MNVHHNIPIIQRHFFEGLIPQNTRIVNENVYGAKLTNSIIDNALRPGAIRDRRFISNRDAAGCFNLRNNLISRVTCPATISAAT